MSGERMAAEGPLPLVLRADRASYLTFGSFLIPLLVVWLVVWVRRPVLQNAFPILLLAAACAGAWAWLASLRIEAAEEGLEAGSLLFRRKLRWEEIGKAAIIEKTQPAGRVRGRVPVLLLYDRAGNPVLALPLKPYRLDDLRALLALLELKVPAFENPSGFLRPPSA